MERRYRFYQPVRAIIVAAYCWPWRVRAVGVENVPTDGAFVLAPSHRSQLDIPWLGKVTKRRIRFMGKVSLFRLPVMGRAFEYLGGFAVERDGNDVGPLRESLAILAAGEPLAVYPEGSRQHGHEIQVLQPGAAYLAIKARVPLLPIAIAGSEEPFRKRTGWLPRFERGVVLIGEPITPPAREGNVVKREVVDQLSDQLRVALQKLYDEAYALR